MNRKLPAFVAMATVDAIPLLVLDHWGYWLRRYGLIHLVRNGNLPKGVESWLWLFEPDSLVKALHQG